MSADHLRIIASNPDIPREHPERSAELAVQAMAVIAQLDPQLSIAIKESRVAQALPDVTSENDSPFAYFDSWMQAPERGYLLETVGEGLSQDTAFKTEKWQVRTSLMKPGVPRVLLRFSYVDKYMNEGYAYFMRPADDMTITSAMSYHSSGLGAARTWHQTDVNPSIAPETYMNALLNSHVRTLDIAAYCIDFPTPHGGLSGEVSVGEMLQKAA